MVDGLVSIITPCYNGERFIAETIESVLGQTYAHWELLIVDDGSRDNTAQVAASYAARDGRIQVVRQANGGTATARNNAMRRAKGAISRCSTPTTCGSGISWSASSPS